MGPSSKQPAAHRARQRGTLSTVLQRTAAVVLGLLLAEGTLRVVLFALGQPYDSAVVRAEGEALAASESAGSSSSLAMPGLDAAVSPNDPRSVALTADPQVPHPFVGFDTVASNAAFEAQLAALRADPSSLEPYFTVLVIGGSVAQYFADPQNGGLEPLRAAFASDPRRAGRELLFLNHGRAAYKQPQQSIWFQWLLSLGLEPDVLINLDGFNEVAVAAHNVELGVHPLYPMGLRWATSIASSQTPAVLEQAAQSLRMSEMWRGVLHYRLERSAILGTLARTRQAGFEHGRRNAEQRALGELNAAGNSTLFGPPFTGDPESALALATQAWEEASRNLHAICQDRGIQYLHVLQPTLHDAGSKVLTDEERRSGSLPPSAEAGARRGYVLLREGGQRLADQGIAFIDASLVFEDIAETIYFDGCHFVRPGTVILGAAIARAL